MVDRGGNFEGWSGSPQSNPYPGPSNNFNSHRQVYMQQLQNFSTNFAHLTNGYPPTHYAPLPAHHSQQGRESTNHRVRLPHPGHHHHGPPGSVPQQHHALQYSAHHHIEHGAPLPAHIRSNPYQPHAHYSGPRGGAHCAPQAPPLHHPPQYPQQYPPPPASSSSSSSSSSSPSSYSEYPDKSSHFNNGYYKRGEYPPHPPHPPHYPHPSSSPYHHNGPQQLQYEGPMNLTPKSSHERTILNTPNYQAPSNTSAHAPHPPSSIPIQNTSSGAGAPSIKDNNSVTKPETISVPTCIPIHDTFPTPTHTMIQPSVSWKRKAAAAAAAANGGDEELPSSSNAKRLKTEDPYTFNDEDSSSCTNDSKKDGLIRDTKENTFKHSNKNKSSNVLLPFREAAGGSASGQSIKKGEQGSCKSSSEAVSIIPLAKDKQDLIKATTPSSVPKTKKKKESLKQVQQQVLQEQQQIMRTKEAVVVSSSVEAAAAPPPPREKANMEVLQPPPPPVHDHLQGGRGGRLLQPHFLQQYHQQQQPPPLHNSNSFFPTYPYGGHPSQPPLYPHQQEQQTYYQPNSPSYPPPRNSPSPPPLQLSTATATTVVVTSSIPSKALTQPTVKTTVSKSENSAPKTSSSNSSSLPPKKGGTLWALPIVPKLPQKPLSKERKNNVAPPPKKDPSSATSVKDVWLSAFGANKSTKKESSTNCNNNHNNEGEGTPKDPTPSSLAKTTTNVVVTSSVTKTLSSSPNTSSSISSPPTTSTISTTTTTVNASTTSILISQLTAPPIITTAAAVTTQASPTMKTILPGVPCTTSIKRAHKTYLDIPPELRRRPRPNYGGIIHFAPNWESAVKIHHEKCRLPDKLIQTIHVYPKILNKTSSLQKSSNATNSSENTNSLSDSSTTNNIYNFENSNPEDDLLPKGPPLGFRQSMSSMQSPFSTATAEVPRAVNNIVDSILENRKKLRITMGRMYKKPLNKDRKKRSFSSCEDEDDDSESECQGLIPTPGLPLLTSDTTDILMGSNYGNFRRQTLLRYLELDQCSDLKAKMLDWKPEVFETKTRRQSNQVRAVTAYREIFEKKRPYVKKVGDHKDEGKLSEPKKECELELLPSPPPLVEIKKEIIISEESLSPPSTPSKLPQTPLPTTVPHLSNIKATSKSSSVKVPPTLTTSLPFASSHKLQPASSSKNSIPFSAKYKRTPKKGIKVEQLDEDDDEDDLREPTQEEEELQGELQKFALDLIEDNPSWVHKVVIQNLVIWEPIDPVPYVQEKKPKKYYHRKQRKRKSGMDFSSSSRAKNRNSAKSRDTSRVGTPEPQEVVGCSAGETILHRASKMGYPDVVAYALDMVKIPPSIKDNAGIPPIHKAAFRGHGHIVNYLLRYGEDPNRNVKGTRPLHEALEGGDPMAVYHLLNYGSDPLLYDYSGNMPLDLTEGDEDMRKYLSGVLADLHGKKSDRWNVSSVHEYVQPNFECDDDSSDSDEGRKGGVEMEFEFSSSQLPPYYQFKDHEGHFIKTSDLKSSSTTSSKGGHSSSNLEGGTLKSCFSIEMSWEEFIKNSHCCLLGADSRLSTSSPPQTGVVKLYRVDETIKKFLGISSENMTFL
ncbi:unnamed protein product [Lepeophtheirus salmonis]|uniref:(salmon louse) hypothetical protein n=1 Tax=Lepeophtheirus salmonis TaxID=72036 RepID=A0A7R8HEX6_LEPSM|nr:unnamed protein product [Lepeophtheirus salmonis]CAF3035988.1 unnamed protein product [Lepeophtheirus salmonis]